MKGQRSASYPVALVVIALFYILFAAMGASRQTIAIETAVAGVFTAIAVLGFKRNLWLVAAGIAAHGVFDLFHGFFIENPGVPPWWPAFCFVVDIFLAGLLAVRLMKSPSRA